MKIRKPDHPKTILAIAMAAGALSWVAHSSMTWCLFGGCNMETREMLLSVMPIEYYDMAITFLSFFLFGLYAAHNVRRREKTESNLFAAMENLERANRDMEHFTSAAAHDLCEPLVVVGGYIKRAERHAAKNATQELSASLKKASEGVSRVQRTVVDLLDFSRSLIHIEPGDKVDCNMAFAQARSNLIFAIRRKGAKVTSGDLPRISGNQTMIALLFQNLIGNSIKFSRQNEKPVIRASCVQNGGDYVFSVEDNGIGINPEKTEDIFKPFLRLHDRKDYPGTGIGLATCRRIVERHGGTIWVEKRALAGAIVKFTVPAGGAETTKPTTP